MTPAEKIQAVLRRVEELDRESRKDDMAAFNLAAQVPKLAKALERAIAYIKATGMRSGWTHQDADYTLREIAEILEGE